MKPGGIVMLVKNLPARSMPMQFFVDITFSDGFYCGWAAGCAPCAASIGDCPAGCAYENG